jgi:hypothetical protein
LWKHHVNLLLHLLYIISTDEDPGLRIESFAVINLRGVSTNKTINNKTMEYSGHWNVTGWHGEQRDFENNEKTKER